MNSATAGAPVSKQSKNHKGFIFRTQGVVSLVGAIQSLADCGLSLNRVHQKPAAGNKDAQLMFIFERGTPQITPAQAAELSEKFLGKYGFSIAVSKKDSIAATSEIHQGVPEHMLLSGNGPTPLLGTEQSLEFRPAQIELLKSIPQVRLPLVLTEDVAATIPEWVEVRGR